MFKRKCYNKLLDWKHESNGRTAILVEGARRVGKTTLIQQFAQDNYDDYIYIDFSKVPTEVARIFRDEREDTDTFLRLLLLYYGKRLPERRSVIIFDEVQRLPIAREYIKHLVADGRFDYIESGSLISIKKNVTDIVIPSEEERVTLNPMDFEEYLWALNQEVLADSIREARINLAPLPDFMHKRAMRLFSEYMLFGGMPQSVNEFIQTQNFDRCDKIKSQILSLYIEDIEKFGSADARRALAIFRQIPSQLSAASKRFKFGSIKPSARFDSYESALNWLKDAHLANICTLCTDPSAGFMLHSDETQFKCYMADTGLLVSHTFSDAPSSLHVQQELQFGRLNINRGMLTENIVAQQLKAQEYGLYFYKWKEEGGSTRCLEREIDFLFLRGFSDAGGKLRVCPIEVKSSKNYKTVSLDDFSARFKKRIGNEIVLHPKQLKVEGRRQYLPLYMSFCL
jgi:hypothetical protein